MCPRFARLAGSALVGVMVLGMALPAMAQEGKTFESLLEKSGLIYEKRQTKGKAPLYILPYDMGEDGRVEVMAEEIVYEAKYKDGQPVAIVSVWVRIITLNEGQKLPSPVATKIADINFKGPPLGHLIHTDNVVDYYTTFLTRGADEESLRMTMNTMASLSVAYKKELVPILKAVAEEK